MLEFKNKIKKLASDDKNVYVTKIEEFIHHYEQRYEKKIRLKKTKKEKEQ